MKFRLLVLALVTATFLFLFFLSFLPPSHKENVVLDIKPGQLFSKTLKDLKSKNLIRSLVWTKLIARATGSDKKIPSGEYLIVKPMNLALLFELLLSGKTIVYSVTFPEGSNIYDMAQKLEKTRAMSHDEFLSAVRDQDFIQELLGEKLYTLEGYLFPETYKITKYMNPRSLIRLMVLNFKEAYQEIKPLENQRARVFKKGKPMTREEVVILASIIEKETGAAFERPLISSVFHNRLKKNMRLETDPTILYGILDTTKKMPTNIRKKDIRRKNRYNTYTFKGFPRGPISNPGKAALLAAVRPKDSDYIFFVSRNDGTHIFSQNYQQHLRAVRKYQFSRRAVKARGYKTPAKTIESIESIENLNPNE